MAEFTEQKNLVQQFYDALDKAPADSVAEALSRFVSPDYRWRGFHPFGEIPDAATVARNFWVPLKQALSALQRRQDVFMAGRNQIDGFESVWVVSMGHLVGLFDKPWLGIRPTGKIAMLRYCEFSKIVDGKIAESAMYFDIPHLMIQAGQNPFPPQTGAHLVQPGPVTHDGLMYGPQPPEDGEKTLATINAMISDLGKWQLGLPLEQELARTWHDDMIWWGPAGIGASYTIERYAKQHSGPFRAAFADRSSTSHICRMAEGQFGGFFGWPNFTARHVGGFMGMPAAAGTCEFRVIDIYRRQDDKLAENWVFIDLLHLWKGLGVDILKRATAIGG